MKKFFSILLVLVVAVGVLAYLNDDFRDWLKGLAGSEHTTSVAYKWKDSKGAWHITNTPPPKGTPYETQEILRNTNVLPDPRKKQK
jgi:hypothetical protein